MNAKLEIAVHMVHSILLIHLHQQHHHTILKFSNSFLRTSSATRLESLV